MKQAYSVPFSEHVLFLHLLKMEKILNESLSEMLFILTFNVFLGGSCWGSLSP